MKIIDVHAHTEFSLERLIGVHEAFKKLNLSKEKLLKDINQLEIEYVFSISKKDGILRPFFKCAPASIEQLIAEKKKYPFLKKIAAVNPENGGNYETLKEYLQAGVVSALKFYLGYNIKKPASKKLTRYYDLASEFKKPVLFHTGYCFLESSQSQVSPKQTNEVIKAHNEQKFLLCHFGYPFVEDTLKALQDFENAFTDLSGLVTYQDIRLGECSKVLRDVRPAVNELLKKPETRDKLMYGSDYPLVNMKQYLRIIGSIIPENMREKVFYQNAKDFFNL